MAAVLVAGLHTGWAQKDGGPPAVTEKAPEMAKDGVPPVVKIPAGSFVMGAVLRDVLQTGLALPRPG